MPDISLNPITFVVGDSLVDLTNPLPVDTASATSATVTLNPVTFVVNGELVSDTNPLPVQVV